MATPFIWTNDDIGAGQLRPFRRMVDFLDAHGIPGVFFVIPRNGAGDLDQDPELCRAFEAARANGHEFYQHGFVHTPFESGVPETWMLDFTPDVRARYDADRLAVEASHALPRMVEMIENGRRIWRRAFGDDSPGYRPGWGAFCGNLYTALDTLGFRWVSSRISALTSWLWNQGLWDQRPAFRDEVPGGPWPIGGLVEYPLSGDYGFRVPDDPDRIAAMADLFVEEFHAFEAAGWPFIPVSHWHGLERDGTDSGYAVHERALPRILESGHAEPMGMAELHERTREGQVARG